MRRSAMSSEFASLIETNTRIVVFFPTPIPGLHLSRYSSPTQPGQGVQCPTLAIVAQGTKQLMLGDETFTYDPGHYLVVSLDLPLSGRITAASKAKPFLGMSLDLDVNRYRRFGPPARFNERRSLIAVFS